MRRQQTGFTLIELMIVVAIVGILASVAMPLYMEFVGKSKWKSAFAELSAGKLSIDAQLVLGITPTLADIHVAATTIHCTNELSFTLGVGTYSCKIIGGPGTVAAGTVTLTRTEEGEWSCASSVAQKFIGNVSQCTGV